MATKMPYTSVGSGTRPAYSSPDKKIPLQEDDRSDHIAKLARFFSGGYSTKQSPVTRLN